MASFSRFTRVIGIRVSQSEYEEMRDFCFKNDLHSIADFVRKAALTYMAPDIREKERIQDVQRLEKQIKKLCKEMADLKLTQQNEAMDSAKNGVDK